MLSVCHETPSLTPPSSMSRKKYFDGVRTALGGGGSGNVSGRVSGSGLRKGVPRLSDGRWGLEPSWVLSVVEGRKAMVLLEWL